MNIVGGGKADSEKVNKARYKRGREEDEDDNVRWRKRERTDKTLRDRHWAK